MNLLGTNRFFYPYTTLSWWVRQVLFVYITNSKFPLSKCTSYFKVDGKYKKSFLIDKFKGQRQCVKLITSYILCIFSEYNLKYIIISIIYIIINIKFSHMRLHCLDLIYFLHLSNKKLKSKKRFTLFCNREDRERQSCEPLREAVEANVVVSEDKIFI